jgi:hypothetical protein
MASEQKKCREEEINPMGGVRPTPLSICKTECVGFLAPEATVLLILIPSLLPSAPWKEEEEEKKKKKMMMMMVLNAAIAEKERAGERELGRSERSFQMRHHGKPDGFYASMAISIDMQKTCDARIRIHSESPLRCSISHHISITII